MKHLIIAKDSGSRVYFDHEKGELIIPPLVTQFNVANEGFGDTWKIIRCEKTLLVFGRQSNTHFLLVSDLGESENYMQFQLQFIQDLMRLKFGPNVFDENQSINFSRHQKALSNLFNTTKKIFATRQCFLLTSFEKIDAPDEMIPLSSINKMIKETAELLRIQHILLFVGTKVLFNHPVRKKLEPIPVYDLLLLIAYTSAHFRPVRKELARLDIPVADYQEHSNVPNTFSYASPSKLHESLGVNVPYQDLSSSSDTNTNLSQSLDEKSEPIDIANSSPQEEININPSPDVNVHVGSIPGRFDARYESEAAITRSKPINFAETKRLNASSPSLPKASSTSAVKREHHDDFYKNLDSVPPLHSQIYLSSMVQCNIHAFELEYPVVLVILTEAYESPEDESKQMCKVRNKIRNELQTCLEFYIAMNKTHLQAAMYTYLHQLPGLVHFILVDRTSERVIAPKITSLAGAQCDEEFKKYSKKYIKNKIWDMVFQSQTALVNGYNTMLMTAGDFQYSYRLWFEEETGGQIPLADKPLYKGLSNNIFAEATRKGAPITSQWYRDLSKRLFNNKRVKCYELYTLYLGGVSAKTIAAHNSTLVEALRSTR